MANRERVGRAVRGYMPSRLPATAAAVYSPQAAHAGFHMSNAHHHQQPQAYQKFHYPAAAVHSRSSSDITPLQTPSFSTQYEHTCADASQEPPANLHYILQTRTTPNSASSEHGASSDGNHRVASPYTPAYITSQEPGPMMPHPQQHVEYGATQWQLSQDLSQLSIYPDRYKMMVQPAPHPAMHMPPAPDAWLERQMAAQLQGESASQEHYPVPLAHKVSEHDSSTHCIKALAPIRRVQDAVTGSAEYSLDPFCPSNMEFQRRAEDELTKFIYTLVESASKMNLNFKYENPISKQCDMSAAEALRGPALDFRWQLKHLEYNRTLFCREVFKGKIGEPEFRRWTRNLREKADKLAHKQHLQDDLRVTEERDQSQDEKSEAKAGTSDAISHLLDEMIQFTEKIYRCHRDKHIPGLDIHRKNLRDIRATYLDFLDYKETIHENMASFEKKKEDQKLSTVERVLQQIAELCRGGDQTAEEAREVVAVRLAAHFDISI